MIPLVMGILSIPAWDLWPCGYWVLVGTGYWVLGSGLEIIHSTCATPLSLILNGLSVP
jgi:hypothetical protein